MLALVVVCATVFGSIGALSIWGVVTAPTYKSRYQRRLDAQVQLAELEARKWEAQVKLTERTKEIGQ